ncbi:MAG TPA: hypothetical protein VIN08_02005 [Ohtaekwangia sp.]|uniref:hypothetical protein n=1 Tax=Ohtaekwangia sp. TaxID=2066019 RepID=UPI002F95C90D
MAILHYPRNGPISALRTTQMLFSIAAINAFILFGIQVYGQSIENRLWVCVAKTVNEKFSLSDNCRHFTLKLVPSNKTFEQRGEKMVRGSYELSNDKKTLTLKSTYSQVFRVEQQGELIVLIDQSEIYLTKSKFYLFPK